MFFNPLIQELDIEKLFELQNVQFRQTILLEDTVPAESSSIGRAHINNLGHFLCLSITGQFSTIYEPDQDIIDNGINFLSGMLIDGDGNRKLMNERIPLSLWLSPGRRRDAGSTALLTTDPPPNSLFYPMEFVYLFSANSDILLDTQNIANVANSYEIAFHGIKIVTDLVRGGRR
jgi:hypothetical protein